MQDFIQQIEQWHNDDYHQQIVDFIENLPESQQNDYDIQSKLARAYNNLGQYQQAIKVLNWIKKQGENDPLWWYKYAYALFYAAYDAEDAQPFEDALQYIYKAIHYFDRIKPLDEFHQDIYNDLLNFKNVSLNLIILDILRHNVYQQNKITVLYKNDDTIDYSIAMSKPLTLTEHEEYLLFGTISFCEYTTHIQYNNHEYDYRCELVMAFPNITDDEKEDYLWMPKWLAAICDMTIETQNSLGYNMILDLKHFCDSPFAGVVIIRPPESICKEFAYDFDFDGEKLLLQILYLVPVYQSELLFALDFSVEALIEKWIEQDISIITSNQRKNALPDYRRVVS